MCNIPGHANMVDFNFYSFCDQLFPFHTSTDNAIKKTRQLIKKKTPAQITKDCFIFLH